MAQRKPEIAPDAPPPARMDSPYLDRDLADLAYVDRILAEAGDNATPLVERLRFVAIASAVLDEFVAVRLARVGDQALMRERVESARRAQYRCFESVLERISGHGLQIESTPFVVNAAEARPWRRLVATNVVPALTPLAVDREHPFPFIAHRQCGLVFELRRDGAHAERIVVPMPTAIPAYLHAPRRESVRRRVETLLAACADELLPGHSVASVAMFRVLRANDLSMTPMFDDLRDAVERGLAERPRNPVVCIEVDDGASPRLRRFLTAALYGHEDGFICATPWPGIARFDDLLAAVEPWLARRNVSGTHFPVHRPHSSPVLARHNGDGFAAMRAGEFMLHWPYDRFSALTDLLWQAANDPDVVAIKQTLYRTDENVVAPLIAAARAGKDVTVVVELEARENERHNVDLSRALDAAGARVVYGLVDLKVHAKMLLIVRREHGELREYANISTGNYHSGNARHYADLSLFSADPAIARDVARVFNYVTGHLAKPATRRLIVAPGGLRSHLIDAINAEADRARHRRPSGIWLKLNSLLDAPLIDALYSASQAGVPVRCIVRRHCALRPGVAGLSKNIEVRSIIGRHLEHARIVCFANGSPLPSTDARVYLSTGDWMPRNFDERVEVLVPIAAASIKSFLLDHVMGANLRDTSQSWQLQPDGEYRRAQGPAFSAQEFFAATPFIGERV